MPRFSLRALIVVIVVTGSLVGCPSSPFRDGERAAVPSDDRSTDSEEVAVPLAGFHVKPIPAEEIEFLRGLLAQPELASSRTAYADWLKQQDDPRAAFLEFDTDLDRITFVQWLEKSRQRYLAEYEAEYPHVEKESRQRKASEPLRRQRRAIGQKLDSDWVAFINTLGCPFQPFFFFDNANPAAFNTQEIPFREVIGTRGAVVTFENDFREPDDFDMGLVRDLDFLSHLKLKNCEYGAASCPVLPFVCEIKTDRRPILGSDVLASLRPKHFQSKYIKNLDAESIPFPGYHPGNLRGVENDEIHNDFRAQHIFAKEDYSHDEKYDAFYGTHGVLKKFVRDGKVWYVLLHQTPRREDDGLLFTDDVVLFAVGLSPNGNRLIGVVTHQVCHNLCD